MRKGRAYVYDTPPAIVHRDIYRRLDAILRRLGGKAVPKPINGRVVLPAVGKRVCKGQLDLFRKERQ